MKVPLIPRIVMIRLGIFHFLIAPAHLYILLTARLMGFSMRIEETVEAVDKDGRITRGSGDNHEDRPTDAH